jgi:hypothetical protein
MNNQNGNSIKKALFDPSDAVVLLLNHQAGLFQTVKDIGVLELRANTVALAKLATLMNVPVITSASVPEGPNGPLIPEIHENAPHALFVRRMGEINAKEVVHEQKNRGNRNYKRFLVEMFFAVLILGLKTEKEKRNVTGNQSKSEGTRRSRLAQHLSHVFLCRLLQSEHDGFSRAASDQ